MTNLMVYGTLKSGHGNNYLLGGARLVGRAVTHRNYCLFNCGFPMAVPIEAKGFPEEDRHLALPVMGEVFEVSDESLARCDRLEGHPDWYVRRVINAKLVDSEEVIQTYIYEMPVWQGNRLTLCPVKENIYVWSR